MKIIETSNNTILTNVKDYDIVNGTFSIQEEVNVIGSYAFKGLKNIREIKIPKNVIAVNSFAFFGSNLESIQFLNPNTILSDNIFCQCSNLKEVWYPLNRKLTHTVFDTNFDEIFSLVNIDALVHVGSNKIYKVEDILHYY